MPTNTIFTVDNSQEIVREGTLALDALPALLEEIERRNGDVEAAVSTVTISLNDPISAQIWDGTDHIEYRWNGRIWIVR
jgi:hypothetical protein